MNFCLDTGADVTELPNDHPCLILEKSNKILLGPSRQDLRLAGTLQAEVNHTLLVSRSHSLVWTSVNSQV